MPYLRGFSRSAEKGPSCKITKMLSFLFERDLVPIITRALLKSDTPSIESRAEHLTIRPYSAMFQICVSFSKVSNLNFLPKYDQTLALLKGFIVKSSFQGHS